MLQTHAGMDVTNSGLEVGVMVQGGLSLARLSGREDLASYS